MMPRILAAIVLTVFSPGTALAGVYTWIDEKGIAHFSDHPPSKMEHERITVRPVATVPMSENLDQGERVSRIRDEVQEALSKPERPVKSRGRSRARAEAKRKKACAAYRDKLDVIQAQLRNGYSNDKGNSLRQRRRAVSKKLSRECILG